MDTISAVVEGRGLDGLATSDFHLLAGETLRGEANRAWQRLLGAWPVFNDNINALPDGDPALGMTRERWLLPLFAELGYGRLDTTPVGGLEADSQAFPVSHAWRSTPIHLLGAGVDLDRRSSGVAGAAKAAPHAMVQELLNRNDEYLWAFLSNGHTLRVLRDNASLVRQAYLEFDLTAIFEGELFSEFVALFLVCHQSRVEARNDTGPGSCWLETWRNASVAAGTRALDHLRDGVVRSLRAFGSGFLRHPANSHLRASLASGDLAPQDYYRSLLRLAYRLLFVFVAEDRNLLHHPDATSQAHDRYSRYFSTARLRRLATRSRSADRHPDLWQSLQLVFGALSEPEGLPALGLPCLGGFLFDPDTLGPLTGAQLANADLLAALRPLALVRDAGGLTRTIDYRNLDSEELGSVYESLLQLVPRHDPGTGSFSLEEIAGNERKTTGSYYTPASLIASLLDTALDPLLDETVKSADSVEAAEAALLRLTVCDPACGSGHFLVAAARRIAKRVAAVRTGDPEPAPQALRTALRDVVGRCIYGVDLNDLAAELAKVSLWLEALEPGKPLSFLDAKIKVGNALLGTTPSLLTGGIPDEAFAQLTGDDKKYTGDLKKRNKHERASVDQGELFGVADLHRGTAAITARRAEVEQYDDASPAGLAARANAWRRLEASPELLQARFLADAWCSAFVWPKTLGAPPALTDAAYRELEESPELASEPIRATVTQLAREYRFFHWHLEFPDVFTVPDDVAEASNGTQGWTGGFTVVLGNPPWLSYSGRQAVETRFGEMGFLRFLYRSGASWPSSHGFFLLLVSRLMRENARAGLVLPLPVATLQGYSTLRETIMRSGLDIGVHDQGENVFEGVSQRVGNFDLRTAEGLGGSLQVVSQPSWVTLDVTGSLDSSHRNGAGAQVSEHVHRGLLDLLRACSKFPRMSFSDPGVHTGNVSKRIILGHVEGEGPEHYSPIREGKDIQAFRCGVPKKWVWLDAPMKEGDYCRVQSDSRYTSVPIVLRQTANRPIATRHINPTYFRNSLLACAGVPGVPDEVIVGVLNSSLIGYWYRAIVLDSAQKAFPQVKVGALRDLPLFPIAETEDQWPSIVQVVQGIEESAGGPSCEVQHELDQLICGLYGLSGEQAELVMRASIREVA